MDMMMNTIITTIIVAAFPKPRSAGLLDHGAKAAG